MRLAIALGLSLATFGSMGVLPAAADFDPPKDISADGAKNVAVAMTSHGRSYIVYEQATDVYWRIAGRAGTAAGNFPPGSFLSADGEHAHSPHVAMSPDGKIVAVWIRYDPDNNRHRVQATTGTIDTALNLGVFISPGSVTARDPRAAINANGDVIVIWKREDGRVFARFGSHLGDFDPTVAVSAAGEIANSAGVAIAKDGTAVVVWQAGLDQIKARVRSSSGVWGQTRPVARGETPQLAITQNGTALIAWEDTGIIKARTLSANGTLGAVKTLSGSGQSSSAPEVAITPTGNGLVAWSGYTGSISRAYVRPMSASGVVGSLSTLTPGTRNTFLPQVAINPKGKAVIVYTTFLNEAYAIQARTRSPDGVLSPAETLSATGVRSERPRAAIANNGKAIAAWELVNAPMTIQAAVGE